ncbi:MAG: hypothetical protein Q8Q42_02260 [Nanoarchaeota archaeon]|nr:hypothetical protein [Nanoarchaeota archaeon]
MENLQYNGENVYTHSTNRVTPTELARARTGVGSILDAYFFQIGPDRSVERVEFDRSRIEAQQVGLMVDVKSQFGGQASVAVAGLDRITQFLYDTASAEKDLSALKGREVTEYNAGMKLLGIGIRQ